MLSTVVAIMAVSHTLLGFPLLIYFIVYTGAAFEQLPTDVNYIYNAQMKDSYVFKAKSNNKKFNHCRFTITYNYKSALKVIIDYKDGGSSITTVVNGSNIKEYVGSNNGQYNILCSRYKSFWLTWFNGHIQAGAGTVIGENLEWNFIHPSLSGIPFPMFRISTDSNIDVSKPFKNQCFYKASHPVRNNEFAVIETKRQWDFTGDMLDALFDGDHSSCVQLPKYPALTLKKMVPGKNKQGGISLTIVVGGYSEETYLYAYYRDNIDEVTDNFEGNFRLCEESGESQTENTKMVTFICDFSAHVFIKVFSNYPSPKLCEMIYI